MTMKEANVSFTAKDGQTIFARRWESSKRQPSEAKAVIQLAHGMGEHSTRYEEFASNLVAAGYIVFAHDHRGHGQTARTTEQQGKLADRDGWNVIVDDLVHFSRLIKSDLPNHKLFLFGHSMGSFLARRCLQLYGAEYEGVILSGTGGDPGLMGHVGLLLAKLERGVRGTEKQGYWMNCILFGGYNRAFHPMENPFAWLSRDQDEVSKYILDPACGQVFKTSFYCDLISGVAELHRQLEVEKLRELPRDFPILIFSGTKDPVGNNSKGVREVYETYKQLGFTDVELSLYEEGRHEMLHEINRKEVFADVINWLHQRAD